MTIAKSSPYGPFVGDDLPQRDDIGKPGMPDQGSLLICPTCYDERSRAVVLKPVRAPPLPPVFRFPGQRPNESIFSVHRTSDRPSRLRPARTARKFACPECKSEHMDTYDPSKPAP